METLTVKPEFQSALHLGETAAAVIITFLYPLTLAPIGIYSNGGILGLGALIAASYFAWKGFALNRKSTVFRVLIQLPVTALVSFVLISDAYAQFVLIPVQRSALAAAILDSNPPHQKPPARAKKSVTTGQQPVPTSPR